MRWLLLILILCTCTSVKQLTDCDIHVLKDRKFITNNSIIYIVHSETTLHFSFSGTCTLKPAIYTYGSAIVTVTNAYQGKTLLANTSSKLDVRFREPGRETIMLVWEGHDTYSDPYVVTVEYRP